MRAEVKNYLYSYNEAMIDVEYLSERQAILKAKIESATASIEDVKVSKTKDNTQERLMHVFLNQKIEIDQRKLVAEQRCIKIENQINTYCSKDHALVLKYHYILNYDFTEIAKKMNWSYSKVLKMHRNGIDELINANILTNSPKMNRIM